MKTQSRKDPIKNFFASFSPESLLLHFQSIICHPSNQKYGLRIEYLMAEMLSLQENEFGSKTVTRSELETFLAEIQDLLDKAFSDLEDFDGFDQNKLIPLFWKGHRYYFFYALYDRPYESWKEITESLTSPELKEIPAYARLQDELKKSLEWQTRLLHEITSQEESSHEQEGLYIPGQSFIDRISACFAQVNSSGASLQLGILKNRGRAALQKNITQLGKYLDQFYVAIGEKQFFIYPQLHLQLFYKKAAAAIVKDAQHHEAFMENFRQRLGNVTRAVFKKPSWLYRLLAQSHKEDFLTEVADYTFRIDENKLVIFKAINFRSAKDIGKEINRLMTAIESMLGRLYEEPAVGIDHGRRERMLALVTEHLQIYIVLVYEAFDRSVALYLKKNSAWANTWLFSMTDVKAILANLTDPIDFLKFLQEEKYLQANATLVRNFEFQDRFAWFLRNSHCYITIGADTKDVYFPFNRWGLDHAEKTFTRLNEHLDVFTEVESKFPAAFPDVELYRQNAYSLSDPVNFDTCYLARLSDRFVWIYLPTDPLELTYHEYSSGAQLFGPMLSDYIARINGSLSELLNRQTISEFDILIAPLGFLKRDQEFFSFLTGHITEINEHNPYKFVSLPVGNRHVRTYFIYDFQYSYKIFNTEQNQGERNLMLDLLQSIAFVIESPNADKKESLLEIIDNIIPVGKKGYAVDQLTVDNPDIEQYASPHKPARTDEGVARRTVAIFIRQQGFSPGIYKGESAKLLLKNVYDYLQNLLEQEIVTYHEGFIVYAYQQLEQNEGVVERRKLTAGLRANRKLDYSALDSLKKGTQKDSWLGSAIRLLIHSALRAGMKGGKSPTRMDWTYLLAMSVETLLAATNYEYINHNLLDIQISVDENYRIEIADEMLSIDFSSFSQKDMEKKFSYAIKEFEKAAMPDDEQKKEKIISDGMITKEKTIDETFSEQFGVTYSNIMLVLHILSKRELSSAVEFPVYVMERQPLITQILSYIVIDIDRDDIDKTLAFLTLKEGIFPANKFLYFGAMLRSKERITLCPLIELKDGSILFGRECIDGTLTIWEEVFQGNLPFGVEQNSKLGKLMKAIKKERGDRLEKKAEDKAVEILGRQFVEARIDNFKRLSDKFRSKEVCGEIDLLCVSLSIKTIFVFDCKSMARLHGLYQAKRNVEEFFKGDDSHFQMLKRKKEFVESNLSIILLHFGISDWSGWTIKEGFIVTNVHFAAFFAGAQVDFVDVDDLGSYMLTADDLYSSKVE